MARLEIELLGRFDVRVDNRPAGDFGYDKVRALLAFLAAERREHRRQTVAELLWPEQGEQAARTNLRQAVAKLRRALGPDAGRWLAAGRDRIELLKTPEVVVDLAVFDRMLSAAEREAGSAAVAEYRSALSLYQGGFLDGLVITDSCEFSQWAETVRQENHGRAVDALARVAALYRAGRQHKMAVRSLVRLLELDPWNERAHRGVMELYALLGDRSAALRQYETCRKALAEELGVEPADETIRLHGRILRGELESHVDHHPQRSDTTPGERRRLTVVVAALEGLDGSDPEDVVDGVEGFREQAARITAAFGGRVVRTRDNRFCAYFGYPEANEGTAQAAVEAALAIAECSYEVGGASTGRRFARCGVATGITLTRGSPDLPGFIGSVETAADDLRRTAPTAGVFVGPATARLIAGYFTLAEIDGTAHGYRVAAVGCARSRLEASTRLTPMTGRKRERRRLESIWRSLGGTGTRVMLVVGEPGIGKSRLVHDFLVEAGPKAVIEARCTSLEKTVAGRPVAQLFRAVLANSSDRPPEEQLAAVCEQSVPPGADPSVVSAEVLQLLGLTGDREPATGGPGISAEQRRHRLLRAFAHLISAGGDDPLVIVVEDVHWIDPSSHAFLEQALGFEYARPVLWLLTARPEYHPFAMVDAELLELAPLSAADSAVLARRAVQGVRIPERDIRRIVGRSDGVPLFLEEMVQFCLEREEDRTDGSVPETLYDLLMARLDRLGDAKRILQVAACLGRQFSGRLLADVAGTGEEALRGALDSAVASGLLQRRVSMGGKVAFEFKHALVQDAAYQSQLRRDREQLHRRIAAVLMQDFPEIRESEPQRIAHHLDAGGEFEAAIPLWLDAAALDSRRSAPQEAIAHLEKGLRAAACMERGAERQMLELRLQLSLAGALAASEGYGSSAFQKANHRALQLCRASAGSPELLRILWGLWLGASTASNYLSANRLAAELGRLAAGTNDNLYRLGAAYAMGNNTFWVGDFRAAVEHQRRAVSLFRTEQHDSLIALFGENPAVGAYGFLGWTLWHLGEPDAAVRSAGEGVAMARRYGHAHTLAFALVMEAGVHRFRCAPEAALAAADEALTIASHHGFPLWTAAGKALSGWAKAVQGDPAGVAQISDSLDGMRRAMNSVGVTFLAMLAEANQTCGRFEEAVHTVGEALALMMEKGDRYCEPELYRIRGECLAALGPARYGQALGDLQRSYESALRMGAVGPAVRAAAMLRHLGATAGSPADRQQREPSSGA